jgi:hypothetical protein
MSSIDRFLDDINVISARYVDDIYIFVNNVEEADQVLRKLIPFLRAYDLNLNETKSTILRKSALHYEEPDLDLLFSNAVDEVATQLGEDNSDTGYGFLSDLEDDVEDEGEGNDEEENNVELKATELLFNSIGQFPGYEETIERFCLPLFAKADSAYAIQHVLGQLDKRPSMTQIYVATLVTSLDKGRGNPFVVYIFTLNRRVVAQIELPTTASYITASDNTRKEARFLPSTTRIALFPATDREKK